MAFKNNNLSALSNVAKGSTATLTMPRGVSYDVIHLVYSGVTLEQIKNIKVRINGKAIQEFKDGVRMQALNKYYNRNVKNGVLTFWFMRPEMENSTLAKMTSIGTADISTFDIQFFIDAAAADPVITAHAVKSLNKPLGMITKVKDFPLSSSTSGPKEIDNIPKEGRIAAIHAFKPDISLMEVKVDSAPVNEFNKALNSGIQADFKRVPDDAVHTSVDFILDGIPMEALPMTYPNGQKLQDFRVINQLDTSGAFDVVVEYLTGFAGI